MATLLECQQLSPLQQVEIMALWNQEYPRRISYQNVGEFTAYLAQLEDVFHVVSLDEGNQVNAWYCDFIRDGERWLAMILASGAQGQGLGSSLLQGGKARQPILNAWVVDHSTDLKQDGTVYQSPLPFYKKNGFKVLPEIRLDTPQISAVKMRWCRG